MQAALANLTAVVNAARQQGSADQEALDLLRHAHDLANTLQESGKGEGKDEEAKDQGKGKEKEAGEKVMELEHKVEELIAKGKIRPPATTRIQAAVAQLTQTLQQAG